MSTLGITATILATELAEAVRKDEHPECGGFDLSGGMFGPNVSDWIRSVAKELDSRAQPATIQEGWQLVPKEPNEKIRRAMHHAYWQTPHLPYHDHSHELWNAAYHAMLSAAPKDAT